jgi:hypothetical protein
VDTLLELALIGYDPKTEEEAPMPLTDTRVDVAVDASS